MNKAKVFALYLGSDFILNEKADLLAKAEAHEPGLISYVRNAGYDTKKIMTLEPCAFGMYNFDYCQLILTPLELITDEDAIEVAKMLIGDNVQLSSKDIDINALFVFNDIYSKTGFSYLDIFVPDGNIEIGTIDPENPQGRKQCYDCGSLVLNAYDYLRSKGYCLPYMGQDLYESGIAIKPIDL